MIIPPYIGKFWTLHGIIDLEKPPILLAISTDKEKMVTFVAEISKKHSDIFAAYHMIEVGGALEDLEKLKASPTHEVPRTVM